MPEHKVVYTEGPGLPDDSQVSSPGSDAPLWTGADKGYSSWTTTDWTTRAAQDAEHGRSANGSVPVAFQTSYTEAYNWGLYLKNNLYRNSI